ncbi:hypothetical protein HYG86_12905 [Alkalicella caledoniensis]|uniref:Uncharacterized protein n=1 Tax=Alkalicella caledoniensis TaxID=2731377 RepID=A0A7G9WA95_ALKCA|nr:hypothetical protein [Alkalicella caledoniensis]QNO15607.1 hypothetical protein HYG86_12905 [Alkalicella caledoniensis]
MQLLLEKHKKKIGVLLCIIAFTLFLGYPHIHFIYGKILFNNGKYHKAIGILNNCNLPNQVNPYLVKAYFQIGDYEGGLHQLTEVKTERDIIDILEKYGSFLLDRGNYESIIKYINLAENVSEEFREILISASYNQYLAKGNDKDIKNAMILRNMDTHIADEITIAYLTEFKDFDGLKKLQPLVKHELKDIYTEEFARLVYTDFINVEHDNIEEYIEIAQENYSEEIYQRFLELVGAYYWKNYEYLFDNEAYKYYATLGRLSQKYNYTIDNIVSHLRNLDQQISENYKQVLELIQGGNMLQLATTDSMGHSDFISSGNGEFTYSNFRKFDVTYGYNHQSGQNIKLMDEVFLEKVWSHERDYYYQVHYFEGKDILKFYDRNRNLIHELELEMSYDHMWVADNKLYYKYSQYSSDRGIVLDVSTGLEHEAPQISSYSFLDIPKKISFVNNGLQEFEIDKLGNELIYHRFKGDEVTLVERKNSRWLPQVGFYFSNYNKTTEVQDSTFINGIFLDYWDETIYALIPIEENFLQLVMMDDKGIIQDTLPFYTTNGHTMPNISAPRGKLGK